MTASSALRAARGDLEKHQRALELLGRQIDAIGSLQLKLKSVEPCFDPVVHAEVLSEMDELSQHLMHAGNRLMDCLIQIENEIERD